MCIAGFSSSTLCAHLCARAHPHCAEHKQGGYNTWTIRREIAQQERLGLFDRNLHPKEMILLPLLLVLGSLKHLRRTFTNVARASR